MAAQIDDKRSDQVSAWRMAQLKILAALLTVLCYQIAQAEEWRFMNRPAVPDTLRAAR